MAYIQGAPVACIDPKGQLAAQSAVQVMNLATGGVRTWRNAATAAAPTRDARSQASIGGHSRLLWHQDPDCTTCVLEALAGPGDSLTAVEVRPAGTQQTRQLIVRIPLAAGRPRPSCTAR